MNKPPINRQTFTFLNERFKEAGINPRKKLGQNFLIDLNLIDLLFNSSKPGPDDVVLEIGTGTGSLTARIAPEVARVVTVELDPQLFQMASEELYTHKNVKMLHQDALYNKNRFAPEVLEAVREARESVGERARFKLVANLPYNVATPIISNLLALPDPPVSMTVTIQKELGERIVARPNTKDYSSLSIWIQSQCRAKIVRIMPPTVFWPRPKVESAIMQIDLVEGRRKRISDLAFFHGFVRAMFFHRRKYLRSVLISAVKGKMGKPEVDAILERVQLDPTLRSENVSIEKMIELAEVVRLESIRLEMASADGES
jgi:16S rRNA (adenine1518-N6/adenine1519-N6)-dimethyltransferase